ncbi:MAG: ABC transporter permease [Candidatus Micrarchaeia archaeon]
MIESKAIYVIWLREIKRFIRAKSRVIGMVVMPLLFLVGLGYGFNNLIVLKGSFDYFDFLVPGIIGMTLLFTSINNGASIIWDKEFGFLKEIMVTPNSRTSIALGKIIGGATIALIQGILVMIISILLGFSFSLTYLVLLSVIFMLLISITFISLGLAIGSFMSDFQGFGIVMQFIAFPLFFLSGALVPVGELPNMLKYVAYANPLTYGVDGLRAVLLGSSSFSIGIDILAIGISACGMVVVCAWAFSKGNIT